MVGQIGEQFMWNGIWNDVKEVVSCLNVSVVLYLHILVATCNKINVSGLTKTQLSLIVSFIWYQYIPHRIIGSSQTLSVCFWHNTAPSPYAETSADSIVYLFGSNNAKHFFVHNDSFNSRSAFSWFWPQYHCFLFKSRSRIGLVHSAKWDENLFNWFNISRKRLITDTLVGLGTFWIALVFSRSGDTPFSFMIWSRKEISLA